MRDAIEAFIIGWESVAKSLPDAEIVADCARAQWTPLEACAAAIEKASKWVHEKNLSKLGYVRIPGATGTKPAKGGGNLVLARKGSELRDKAEKLGLNKPKSKKPAKSSRDHESASRNADELQDVLSAVKNRYATGKANPDATVRELAPAVSLLANSVSGVGVDSRMKALLSESLEILNNTEDRGGVSENLLLTLRAAQDSGNAVLDAHEDKMSASRMAANRKVAASNKSTKASKRVESTPEKRQSFSSDEVDHRIDTLEESVGDISKKYRRGDKVSPDDIVRAIAPSVSYLAQASGGGVGRRGVLALEQAVEMLEKAESRGVSKQSSASLKHAKESAHKILDEQDSKSVDKK